MKKCTIIGLMSGTSLDGLDMACIEFILTRKRWSYQIVAAETIGYTRSLVKRLETSGELTALELTALDTWYGRWSGTQICRFIKKHRLNPDLISSHGHTVFHQPSKGFTLQIGSGAAIAAATGITTVCDFRSMDVALGGQGAPLVPIGDELLFGEYDYCLNLGGFANLSFNQQGIRQAFDICPANIVLNALSQEVNKPYDRNGSLSSAGKTDQALLKKLNAVPFFHQPGPKSLGKEWVEKNVLPILSKSTLPVIDKLNTYVAHISMQIGSCIQTPSSRVLITGGGVYNCFLLEKIKENSNAEFIVPDDMLIQFKEALIFAFLGLRRLRAEVNCLMSVTGACRDSVGGSIYLGMNASRK